MKLSIGIVGLPNVGKSTLFNALVRKAQAQVSNYPFCTIKPNIGIVEVPDERLTLITEHLSLSKQIPAPIEFIDIAGLVKGAHKGEGLGNQFLSEIAQCDGIAMVLRAFSDPNIAHVEKEINPKKDAEIVMLEMILKDLETVEKEIEANQKQAKSGPAFAKATAGRQNLASELLDILKKIKNTLDQEKPASSAGLTQEEKAVIKSIPIITQKPIIYVLNISEDQIPPSLKLRRAGKNPPKVNLPGPTIQIAAKTESDLIDLDQKEAKELLDSVGIKQSGLSELIREGFKLLNLITFYTLKVGSPSAKATGDKQVQAWPIPKNTPAPVAAGLIHSDFEAGFIKANVISTDKLLEAGSWEQAQKKGQIRIEGKDYIVQDGDVIKFIFNR